MYKDRSKTEDSKLYSQCIKTHKEFTTDACLAQMHHPYDTNKNESMNKFITNFVPKNFYLGKTINLEGRVMMSVRINSQGYQRYFENLFCRVGLTMTAKNKKVFQHLDTHREKSAEYHKRADVKHKLATMRQTKIIEEMQKERSDYLKGLTYNSGMAAPGAKPMLQRITGSKCGWCGLKSHKM